MYDWKRPLFTPHKNNKNSDEPSTEQPHNPRRNTQNNHLYIRNKNDDDINNHGF